MPSPRTLPPGRVEGLDGWRAALMIGGILLHACSWLSPRPLFEAVTLLSHTFRMGAFFAISGFLTARALTGRSRNGWLQRRLIQIGFPTLFGLGVLCPLITATIAALPGRHPQILFNWYHLWFLIALLLYAPLAVLADGANRRSLLWRLVGREDRAREATVARALATTGMLSLLCMVIVSLVIGGVGTPDTMPMLAGWRSIACYWPDFMLGFAASRSPALQAAMLRDWRTPTVVLAILALAYAGWFLVIAPYADPGSREWVSGMLPLLGEAIAPPAVFALILRSTARVQRIGPALRAIADASFTIYVVHVPIIAMLTLAVVGAPMGPEIKYLTIAAATLSISFAFHHMVVRRHAWLALIFCGQPLAPRPVYAGPRAFALSRVLLRRNPRIDR